MLLDACVYQENAKEEPSTDDKPIKPDVISARQQKIVDACQCASARVVKPVKGVPNRRSRQREREEVRFIASPGRCGRCTSS